MTAPSSPLTGTPLAGPPLAGIALTGTALTGTAPRATRRATTSPLAGASGPAQAFGRWALTLFVALVPVAAASAQQVYLKAPNADAGDLFGGAVALSGDTLVVAAQNESSSATGVDGDSSDDSEANAGAVYVFERNGSTWVPSAYLKASNTDKHDRFGVSVDIDGDTLVVGAYLESSAANIVDGDGNDNSAQAAGAAYVFVRSGSTWVQQAYLKASNPSPDDRFGIAVAIDGNTILVGAVNEGSDGTDPDDDSLDDAGAAYVFVRSGSSWTQQAMLKAHVPGAGDRFGIAVAADGDRAVVGGYYEDSAATGIDGDATDDSAIDAGAAYVFVRSGTTWSQEAYIKSANADADDNFGFPIHFESDRIVIGARSEDGGSPGVDGDASDNSAPDAGAVYVFERAPGGWSQAAYLKPSVLDGSDRFGYGLDLSGDTIVVGAHWEQSQATGIDGDPNDNSLDKAGAAYVFGRTQDTWAQRAYVKADHPGSVDLFGRAVAIDGDVIAIGARGEDGSQSGDGSDDRLDASGAAMVHDLDYWHAFEGCHGNLASIAPPKGAARIGNALDLVIDAGSVTSGLVATFRGALSVDGSGCGAVLGPGEEALVAFTPTPTLVGVVPLVLGSAIQTFTIPPVPALVGLRVTVQAVAIDTTTFASALSTAIEFHVQP